MTHLVLIELRALDQILTKASRLFTLAIAFTGTLISVLQVDLNFTATSATALIIFHVLVEFE